MDLPGHGTRAGEPYSTQGALAVVDEAVGRALPGQRVVLAGHSLGGYVSAAWAHRHPRDLDALVLIGATADPSRHPRLVFAYTGFARLIPLVGAERMARFANRVLRRLGMDADALPNATGYAVTPDAWAAVVREASADQLADLERPGSFEDAITRKRREAELLYGTA